MQNFRNREQALKVVGQLSEPSKMPCWGFSLPATECKIGQKLRNVQGSVCSKCYALKGRYVFNETKNAMYRRFRKLYHPRWIDAMVFLIKKHPYFRWHDSGDIQSVTHLRRIARVAENTPNTLHWLPTREYKIVKQFCEQYKVPKNLIIRLSATKIDGPAPELLAKTLGVQVSGVSTGAFNCPAPKQGNACLDCRACWNRSVWNITYSKH